MHKSHSVPQRLRGLSQGFSKWPQAIRDLFAFVLLASTITFVVVFAVPDSAWSSTNASSLEVDGSIEKACSGNAVFWADNTGTLDTYVESVVGVAPASHKLKAGKKKPIGRKGAPGDQLILRGPADAELDRDALPRRCGKTRGRIHVDCRTNQATAVFVNKTKATVPFGASVRSPQGDQMWTESVPPGATVKFFFDGKVMPRGTVLTTRSSAYNGSLDLRVIKKKCG